MVTGATERHDMVTGVTERHDMVTGATERHDMVTGATERHDMVTGATERHDMMTGATKRHDKVTEVQKESVCGQDMVTGVHKEVTHAPLFFLQESRKRTPLPVNSKSAVRIPPRPSKQTKFCWPFSSWQTTTIL